MAPFWQSLRDHIYELVVNASAHRRLVERAVVGLLRIAIRLLRRDEISQQVRACVCRRKCFNIMDVRVALLCRLVKLFKIFMLF